MNANITTLMKLSGYSEIDILKLHGIGKTTIPILKIELDKAGLIFSDWREMDFNTDFAIGKKYLI